MINHPSCIVWFDGYLDLIFCGECPPLHRQPKAVALQATIYTYIYTHIQ